MTNFLVSEAKASLERAGIRTGTDRRRRPPNPPPASFQHRKGAPLPNEIFRNWNWTFCIIFDLRPIIVQRRDLLHKDTKSVFTCQICLTYLHNKRTWFSWIQTSAWGIYLHSGLRPHPTTPPPPKKNPFFLFNGSFCEGWVSLKQFSRALGAYSVLPTPGK